MKEPVVLAGFPQQLHETPLGKAMSIEGFLNRFLLINQGLCDAAPAHIAAHIIQGLEEAPVPYVEPHFHPKHDEIGLVIGAPGALTYEIVLNGVVHRVESPGSVYIPAGTTHRARAIHGNGAYICILMDPRGPSPDNTRKASA